MPEDDRINVLDSLSHPDSYAAVFHVALVQMDDDFKTRLKEAYQADSRWATYSAFIRHNGDHKTNSKGRQSWI